MKLLCAYADTGTIPVFLLSTPSNDHYLQVKLVNALQTIDEAWRPTDGQLLFSKHHQSHAASAFFASPFSSAVILTVDGVGEWETTSVSIGTENQIRPECSINFPHSLGLLYSAFTYVDVLVINNFMIHKAN